MSTSAIQKDTSYEVADIFQKYGEDYRQANGLTKRQHSAMKAIEHCRTPWFGYHEDHCDNCEHISIEYNSCRDRHCPRCQGISKRKWIKARLNDILPVPYYHVVFTLPPLLQALTASNKKLIYNLLFSCAAETLLTFGRDPKWLGGEIGFFGILHTWGQTLWHHPHLHFIVPGGALSKTGQWVEPRYKEKFLFPVHALSKVFQGKFIQGLKAARKKGDLIYSKKTVELEEDRSFTTWLNQVVAKKWIVYCKPPFGSPEQVVRYVGRYTHRVAISSRRIVALHQNQVVFKYKDYKNSRKSWETMSLAANEFISRFMTHILPSGFHKIRHYGFLANGRRKTTVPLIKNILNHENTEETETGTDWHKECPACKKGQLIPMLVVTAYSIIYNTNNLLLTKRKQNQIWDTS